MEIPVLIVQRATRVLWLSEQLWQDFVQRKVKELGLGAIWFEKAFTAKILLSNHWKCMVVEKLWMENPSSFTLNWTKLHP
jgi:hypothetical protein